MANITLRLVKGTPLTNQEVDNNFSNINLAKVEIGRDLSGNIYYPHVAGIQGRDVSNVSPSNAQVLTWLTSSNAWVPQDINSVRPDSVVLGTDTIGDYVANLIQGSGITITSGTGERTSPTIAANVTSVGSFVGAVSNTNLLSSILQVDGSGSTLDADLLDGEQGTYYLDWTNATNKPDPVITVTLSGDVSGSASATLENVTSNTITISTTIGANSVELGADTTGPYVSNITVGSGLTVSGTADEGNVVTVSHADTSSVVNVSSDNSDGTVIQDVTLNFDTFGHVTSASVATVDLDSRFLRLSGASTQFVTGPIDFQGNVTFSGNVTTISANNLIIEDNLIQIAKDNVSDVTDFGIIGHYNTGSNVHAGFFRDASDNGTWKIFDQYAVEPTTNVNIDTANASFRLANFAANVVTLNTVVLKSDSDLVTGNSTLTTTSETSLGGFSTSTYTSGKFVITGKEGSNVQISELLVVHNGTTASSTEYGVVKTNQTVFTANVDINSGNFRVLVSGATADSTKYTWSGTLLRS